MSHPAAITVSLVSHGHESFLARLLPQLRQWHDGQIARLVIVHNLPAHDLVSAAADWPFDVVEIHNPQPLGFGANHNQAFRRCETDWFCVLNPDIEFTGPGVWTALLAEGRLDPPTCVYPRLLNPDGSVQDNERAVVTPWSLWRRHALRLKEAQLDWVSAAFWLLPAHGYRALGGFDERFTMYCEDTDFCLRWRLAGGVLRRAPVALLHPASRSSRSNLRHLGWHLSSLLRLWLSPVLRRYLALQG